jgi:hypothetical protein
MKLITIVILFTIYFYNTSFPQQISFFSKKIEIGSQFNSNANILLSVDSTKINNMNIVKEVTEDNNRNGYAYLTIGLAEVLGFGFGYQINNDYAIGIKYGGCWIAKGFRYGAGFGLKLSRYLSSKFFNNINLELTTYTSSSVQFTESNLIKGASIDFNIGNESKLNAINFIWSVGFITSVAKGAQPLFVPSLKTGFNINF